MFCIPLRFEPQEWFAFNGKIDQKMIVIEKMATGATERILRSTAGRERTWRDVFKVVLEGRNEGDRVSKFRVD